MISKHYRAHVLMGLAGALIVSLFAYFVGWVVAWVIRGFRKESGGG